MTHSKASKPLLQAVNGSKEEGLSLLQHLAFPTQIGMQVELNVCRHWIHRQMYRVVYMHTKITEKLACGCRGF